MLNEKDDHHYSCSWFHAPMIKITTINIAQNITIIFFNKRAHPVKSKSKNIKTNKLIKYDPTAKI